MWVVVVLLLLAGAGGALLLRARAAGVEVRTVAVRAVEAGGRDRTVLNSSGYVTARRSATVSSKVTGKVVVVLIEEGMRVKEGQELARLDDTNVKASLRLAEAQVDSARSSTAETRVRLQEAERDLKRQAELLKNRITAEAEFDHAEVAVAALKARVAQQEAEAVVAERQAASWRQQVEDTVIRAPFSGVVTSKNAQPGEMISPISAGGGFTRTGICTIVDMDSLEIEIDVNESYINRVEAGQACEAALDAYPDWKIPCKVIAIIPTADRQKSTVRVRIGFDKLEPRILPDMSVKVAFRDLGGAAAAGVKPAGVAAPKAAVRQQGGRDVMMVVAGGRVERRAVTLAAAGAEKDEVIVTAGLAAGERVAVGWPEGLVDGATVREARP